MLELLLVFGGIVGVGVIGLVSLVITPELMVQLGLWALAAGLLIGLGLYAYLGAQAEAALINMKRK